MRRHLEGGHRGNLGEMGRGTGEAAGSAREVAGREQVIPGAESAGRIERGASGGPPAMALQLLGTAPAAGDPSGTCCKERRCMG